MVLKISKYPSKLSTNKYGKCMVATKDLKVGTIVQKFEGKLYPYKKIPKSEICHALNIGDPNNDDLWMICETDARYFNHSCDPNCLLDDDLTIVTIKKVKAGEELTYIYNDTDGPAEGCFWDDRWTFDCKCGSKKCQGKIDRYVKQ